jgi:hypothetical protein
MHYNTLYKKVLDNTVDGTKIQRLYSLKKRFMKLMERKDKKGKNGEVVPVHATKTYRW